MKLLNVNLLFEGKKIKVGELEVISGGMINENEYIGRSRGWSEDGELSWHIQTFEHLDGGDFHAIFQAYTADGEFIEYYTTFDVLKGFDEINIEPDNNAQKKFDRNHKAIWG